MDRQALRNAASDLGLLLSPEQLDQFEAFEENLYTANEVMNLTRVPRHDCWIRHFLDSLLFQDLMPGGAKILDIGTGPGFPAWPLACARPDLKLVALDSNGKMLGFLRQNPLPNLRVIEARAEEWAPKDEFDLVTGRAVAPLTVQLEISAPRCRVGGAILPLRTPNDEEVIKAFDSAILGLTLDHVETRPLPGTDIVRNVPVYMKTKATAKRYPRSWSEIKRKPLA